MTNWSPKKSGINTNRVIRMNKFRKFRFGSLSVSSIAIILFIALGAFYMVAVNVASTKGARLHTLQLEKERIEDENERLALEAARLASLAVIEGGAQEKIEIGDDGRPTGRIVKDEPKQDTSSQDSEEVSYIPKMVRTYDIDYLNPSGPLAHK